MKAAVIRAFGDIDVLQYADRPIPQPSPGHVLIKVLAAGVNRFDHYIREGSVAPELPFPHILGADAAGEVAALGEGVTGFRVGDAVIPASARENVVEHVLGWTDGRGADVVLDNVGGAPFAQSIDAVRGGGIVVAYGFLAGTEVTFDIRNFFFGQKRIRGTAFGDMRNFAWGLEQVRAGRIKPLLDRALPLSQAAEAHRLIANNEITGNVVLLPWAA